MKNIFSDIFLQKLSGASLSQIRHILLFMKYVLFRKNKPLKKIVENALRDRIQINVNQNYAIKPQS